MPKEKCTNYDVCEKYGLYNKCTKEYNDGMLPATLFCDVYQKQMLTILASIDDKLSKLLEK